MMRTSASILGLLLFAASASATATAMETEQLTGTLNVVWGDSPPNLEWQAHQAFFLVDDNGQATELDLPSEMMRAAGGVQLWNGRRVSVTVGPKRKAEIYGVRSGHEVFGLKLLPSQDENEESSKALSDGKTADGKTADSKALLGTKPWVSILCKFADKNNEPNDLAFFQGMYANVQGGLDHYWRELSYDNINIAGSTAVNWVTLPHPQTHYIPTPGSNFNSNLSALFNDCTAAADAFVDFSNNGNPFVGINMMFNDLLDCCAWGGGRFATLDGVTKSWSVTWEPPWGYANEGVMGHEMGHGYGLPHSNNSDNDGYPYDSPWDVMSSATGFSVYDATYGALGKHTISYHKDVLGWIRAEEKYTASTPGTHNVTIDFLTLASTSNYRMAQIPIGAGNTFYTVEARQQAGSYDANLPGTAIIIHHVDASRSEDAWVVDGDTPAAGYSSNEGVMWRVGETFEDLANEISITVVAATANGFEIQIGHLLSQANEIFADNFESGFMSNWQ